MGSSIYPIGGPSLGLAAKLSNNYLSALIALATSEAMNLGIRLGLDPHVLSAYIKESSGSNYTNSKYNPVPGVCPDAAASKGYEGGFKVKLMIKDMSLAIKAAEEVGAKLVLADAGLGAYEAAEEDPRCKDKDSRVVYRWLGGIEPEVP
jgi:3-hydroxyisobutyrate/3-hydroxypropionate dehydrogenase